MTDNFNRYIELDELGSSFATTAWQSSNFVYIEPPKHTILNPRQTTVSSADLVARNYYVHHTLVSSSSNPKEHIRPVAYFAAANRPSAMISNSADSSWATVAEHYDQIKQRLLVLKSAEMDEDEIIEEGAVDTALSLIDDIRLHNLAPPAIASHSGEAIVMLWAIGDTTYAITVTDGEIGYVVRRSRKTLRIADSIRLDAFKLEDIR